MTAKGKAPLPSSRGSGAFVRPGAAAGSVVQVGLAAAERVRAVGFPAEAAYATDPVCGARRHVWDRTSPSRGRARPYVEGTG